MDADESNDIDDTEESAQIAKVCRSVYDEFKTLGEWAHLKDIRQLDSVADSTKPTLLTIPGDFDRIEDFRYESTKLNDTFQSFTSVCYLEPADFLDWVHSRRTDADNVVNFNTDGGILISVLNDRAPERWTTFDEVTVICDAYDAEVDTTLIKSKTIVEVKRSPAFQFSNTFDFSPMPSHVFPTFLARCRVKCHEYFMDAIPQTDSQEMSRGLARLRFQETRVNEERRKRRSFGRRSRNY
jgi:hypothetical protein